MSKLKKIALASDHAGFELKKTLIKFLEPNYEILDLGTDSLDSVDYPDYARKACEAILNHRASRAILICGSGIGMCIAANKYSNIRCSVAHDLYSAKQGVEHDHMNILALGARVIKQDLAKNLAINFLEAKESQDPKYLRRINKIKA